MPGDGGEEARDDDRVRVPDALRERVTELFVEYRGYEPSTFQESLSLVTDLAAARLAEASDDPLATTAGDSTGGRAAADAAGSESAAEEPVTNLSAEVVDDVTADSFGPVGSTGPRDVTDGPASPGPGDATAASATDGAPRSGRSSALDDGGDSGDVDEQSFRVNPESSCALCGDVHRVSVLQTTILDRTGTVALICPSCAD